MGATTGTATVVVTDLVESTVLRSKLGERVADDLRREHDAALGDVIVRNRGRVVKGVGDGVLAAFSSATDAVTAATAMQRTVQSIGRRRALSLAVRIGVSAGDVSWEDEDCFGLPVVEAARLCAAGHPGQILCAEIVRSLARGRGDVEYRPLGQLSLKGLDGPLAVVEVPWAPVEEALGDLAVPCVGRESELSVLLDRWELARDGSGSVVLVAGEPGIGKTRLVEEVARAARASGGAVWWGASDEGGARPYGAVSEMLEDYVRDVPAEVVARQVGPGASVLGRLSASLGRLAATGGPDTSLPPEAERERTIDALFGLAAAVSTSSPLLVVFDDAHWADAASVDVMRHLARRARRLAMLVVIAYRQVDLTRHHPLAATLEAVRRDPSVRRVALPGLDAAGVGALLRALAGHDDVPPSFVETIAAETGGNPFFVREVAIHLIEEGRIRRVDGRWVADDVEDVDIPEGVRDVIGRRLSRLSADANRLLSVAAAFDAGFDFGDVAAVAALEEEAALDGLDEALAAGVLVRTDDFDRYQFAHALFRHTLWAELSPSRQVRLHRAVADQLAARSGDDVSAEDAMAVARHFHRSAALAGSERGVDYALTAADLAATRFAYHAEHQAMRIALDLLPEGDVRQEAFHERAARCAIAAGIGRGAALHHAARAIAGRADRDGPVAACALAVQLGRLADMVESNAGWAFGKLVSDHRPRLDETSDVAVQLLAWEVDEAEFLDPANPGIAVDTPQRRRLNHLAWQLPPARRPSGSGGYFSHDAASVLSDYRSGNRELAWALGFGGPGLYREAVSALSEIADRMLAEGYVSAAMPSLALLGRLHLVLGELEAAAEVERQCERLVDRVEPGSNAAVQFEGMRIFRAQLVDFDMAGALARLERVLASTSRSDLHWVSGGLRLWHACLRVFDGDRERGVEELVTSLPVIARSMLGAPNVPALVHFAARALWLAECSNHVELLERNLRTKVLEPDFCYAESDARYTAALLCACRGRGEEARGWFRRAHERLEAQGAVLVIAHACCDEALMEARLGRGGDPENGRRRLETARQLAARLPLPNLTATLDQLEELLGR